jgi:hypothetical protein
VLVCVFGSKSSRSTALTDVVYALKIVRSFVSTHTTYISRFCLVGGTPQAPVCFDGK